MHIIVLLSYKRKMSVLLLIRMHINDIRTANITQFMNIFSKGDFDSTLFYIYKCSAPLKGHCLEVGHKARRISGLFKEIPRTIK